MHIYIIYILYTDYCVENIEETDNHRIGNYYVFQLSGYFLIESIFLIVEYSSFVLNVPIEL